MSDKKTEIVSLNIDDLDIEELENRLELAAASPGSADLEAPRDECSSHCGTDCYSFSAASLLGLDKI